MKYSSAEKILVSISVSALILIWLPLTVYGAERPFSGPKWATKSYKECIEDRWSRCRTLCWENPNSILNEVENLKETKRKECKRLGWEKCIFYDIGYGDVDIFPSNDILKEIEKCALNCCEDQGISVSECKQNGGSPLLYLNIT